MSNYVSCSECDDRLLCGLALPSKPSFGCLAGVKDGKKPQVKIVTLCYLKGVDYIPVIDGPFEETTKMAEKMPFIETPNGIFPTAVLPKGMTF